jgi:hypothetical protein
MSGRTISGVVPSALFEVAQQATEYEGTTMSALVSSALALYLGLPGAARRSARYVLTTGTPNAQECLLDGCSRAIAQAAHLHMTAQLALRAAPSAGITDEAIEAEAVAAVQATSAARNLEPPRRRAVRQKG